MIHSQLIVGILRRIGWIFVVVAIAITKIGSTIPQKSILPVVVLTNVCTQESGQRTGGSTIHVFTNM